MFCSCLPNPPAGCKCSKEIKLCRINWGGRAGASHLIRAPICIQHATSTWLLEQRERFVDEYALFITNSLCQRLRTEARWRQHEDVTARQLQNPEKSTVQSKESDPPYIRNSPDSLRPKTSLFCSASTSPSPWLSKENLKTKLKGNRHQK